MSPDAPTASLRRDLVPDLAVLCGELASLAERSPARRSGRTVVAVGPLRLTAIALAPGAELAEHENPGAATLQVLAGTCCLVAGDDEVELCTGSLVQIPDRRHALTTAAGCVVLLTVALVGPGTAST